MTTDKFKNYVIYISILTLVLLVAYYFFRNQCYGDMRLSTQKTFPLCLSDC